MKGIVYQIFNQFIEENISDEAWEEALIELDLNSGGVYTAVGTYDSNELFKLIQYFCEKYNIEQNAAVHQFGIFLFPALAEKYPVFIQDDMSLKDFIKTIDDVIHVEVRKLYPDAELPRMQYAEPSDDSLIMYYNSPRKLCHLALGLIDGAAKHFNEKIEVDHKTCMHQGAEKCEIEMRFS